MGCDGMGERNDIRKEMRDLRENVSESREMNGVLSMGFMNGVPHMGWRWNRTEEKVL